MHIMHMRVWLNMTGVSSSPVSSWLPRPRRSKFNRRQRRYIQIHFMWTPADQPLAHWHPNKPTTPPVDLDAIPDGIRPPVPQPVWDCPWCPDRRPPWFMRVFADAGFRQQKCMWCGEYSWPYYGPPIPLHNWHPPMQALQPPPQRHRWKF